MATRPTLLASWMWAMPETTVQKMIGAIIILISFTKPSPIALIHSFLAKSGKSQPTRPPSTMAMSTWIYSVLYQGLGAPAWTAVAAIVVMGVSLGVFLGVSVAAVHYPENAGYTSSARAFLRCATTLAR